LVFINTCFGFSFGSLFFVFDGLLTSNFKFEKFCWVPLPTYLILKVWEKYRSYYIPLQFYSRSLTTLWEEGTTYFITLFLGLIGLFCARAPTLVLPSLFILISLTYEKTRQMRQTLQSAPSTPHVAIAEVDYQAHMLWADMFLLTAVIILLYPYAFEHQLPDRRFAFVAGAATVIVHHLANLIYVACYRRHDSTSLQDYIVSLQKGWPI